MISNLICLDNAEIFLKEKISTFYKKQSFPKIENQPEKDRPKLQIILHTSLDSFSSRKS